MTKLGFESGPPNVVSIIKVGVETSCAGLAELGKQDQRRVRRHLNTLTRTLLVQHLTANQVRPVKASRAVNPSMLKINCHQRRTKGNKGAQTPTASTNFRPAVLKDNGKETFAIS